MQNVGKGLVDAAQTHEALHKENIAWQPKNSPFFMSCLYSLTISLEYWSLVVKLVRSC